MVKHLMGLGVALTLALGCNALDDGRSDDGVVSVDRGGPVPFGSDARLEVPTDTRPAVQALSTPPPITGGTLAISPDGRFAVAADPARDQVSIVDLVSHALVGTLELRNGDEPGRVAIDDQGRAHVALRRGGDVVSLELTTAEKRLRRPVCAAPRGIDHDPATDELVVACADGVLARLPADGGEVTQRLQLDADLRDVIVQGEEVLVTRFKSAELLSVGPDGSLVGRRAPRRLSTTIERVEDDGSLGVDSTTAQPHVAWRALQGPGGETIMLHQAEQEDAVELERDSESGAGSLESSPYGGGGLGFGCAGIVQTAVTELVDGERPHTRMVGGAVLAVDMAFDPEHGRIALAQAGLADPGAPRPTVVFPEGGEVGGAPPFPEPITGPGLPTAPVLVLRGETIEAPPFGGDNLAQPECELPTPVDVDGQATAVAYLPDGRLAVQTREPAALHIINAEVSPVGDRFSPEATVALSDESVADTGHDLFHRDAGAGIACASCHAEGGDDGHTWNFSPIGMRRTQAVHVGLEGTAPFHWDGDMADLEMLMTEVMVGRMGGVHQSDERRGAMASWMFSLTPPPAMVADDDEAAMRGKAIFESAEVGCADCHAGRAMTDNLSYDVGTGEPGHMLQVPSLRGVAYRGPFIHTGCAETLRDRFDPDCGGGDRHGRTSQLNDTQIDDLVAYLRSL
ncbi:MAG: cytochrome c [Myxococcales bacterium]|jgi:mono/diheme cytochrome c family protein